MKEYPTCKYKGFSYKPIVNLSNATINDEGDHYEYIIKGWVKNRKCSIKGSGVYENPEGAAIAAHSFARQEIDKHLIKYEDSLFYRILCGIGFCPVSKFS